ncbi:MAG: SDR family oxidoreductase [Chromatiales bacterium]|jgi:short-subunit dehydrogenase|nr:SDR family oxidoreductase [Chromatiales bacterium]MDH4029229.1 SDR family oxidoreductase [Chromatiales bacterium]
MPAFTDNVVVITGASEGIGRALALALAPQRPKLVVSARSRERLASLAEECRLLGAEAIAVATDVTDERQCQELIGKTVDAYGRIDTLIANAGATMWTRLDELEQPGVLEQVMAVNYFGAAYCTRAALPFLKQTRGRIVAVASVAGLTGVPERTGYSASKHAMVGFFDSLRIELADTGVTVTVIAPDFVVSQIHRRAMGGDGQPLGETPMQESKIMTAEQCARLIVDAMEKRRRLLITSLRGRLGRWFKLFAPGLIDRIASRAIRQRH